VSVILAAHSEYFVQLLLVLSKYLPSSSGLSHFLSCKLQEGDLNCPAAEHTMTSTVLYFSLNNLKFKNAVHT